MIPELELSTANESDFGFEYIRKDLEEDFVQSVLDSYEQYQHWLPYPQIPDWVHAENDEFSDEFSEPNNIFIECLWRNAFPHWNERKITEDERENYYDNLVDDYGELEMNYLLEIEKVLKFFQIFFVNIGIEFTDDDREIREAYAFYHSPLQEVW